MARKRGWTDDEYARFRRMWLEGATIPALALRFSISERAVKDTRLRLKLPTRRALMQAKPQAQPCMQFPFQHHSLIHFKEIPELQAMWERERGKIQEGSQAKWSLL